MLARVTLLGGSTFCLFKPCRVTHSNFGPRYVKVKR